MAEKKPVSVRVSDDDLRIVEALQEKLRFASAGEVWRQGLYLLADKHKVPTRIPQKK